MRAAIYARRSTEEHQMSSLDVQIEEARRFIESQGWTLLESHIYVENAVSRAEFKKRPALLRLLNAAEARDIDVVVVRDVSRIGGDMVRTTLLMSDLIDAGTRIWLYSENREVMLDNATDKFLVAAKNYASEMERERLSGRTYEHLMVKARAGKNAGGRCYGYDNVPVVVDGQKIHTEYAINEGQAEIVREIFQRYAAGDGLKAIVKALNAKRIPSPRAGKRGTGSWSQSVIHSMLRNERYVGRPSYGKTHKTYRGGTKVRIARDPCDWIRIERPDLRIVSDELWSGAHAKMRTNEKPNGKGKVAGRKPKYMMSQLARCGGCGGPVKVTNGKQGRHTIKVYMCAYRHERGPEVCEVSLRRPVDRVNKALVDWVRSNVFNEDLLGHVLQESRRRLEQDHQAATGNRPMLEKEARRLRSEIDRLVAAVATGTGAAEPLVKAIDERQQQLSEAEARLRSMAAAPKTIELELRRMEALAKKRMAHLAAVLERNPEEARQALRELFPGKLYFYAIETAEGRRFEIRGEAVIGPVVAGEGLRPNWASPTGFEPVLQP